MDIAKVYFKKPISADGEAIDIGTTWHGGNGQKWQVTGYLAGRYNVLIRSIDNPKGYGQPAMSRWLTRTKPDSFEQIIEDARKHTITGTNLRETLIWLYTAEDLEQRLKNLGRWSK